MNKELIENTKTVELIRCKDCAHYYASEDYCCLHHEINMLEHEYCSKAERKDDEEE